jgi:IS30 family transposase
MTHCSQLSINEREEISLGLAQGLSKNYIALSLGRSSSTICRRENKGKQGDGSLFDNTPLAL